MTNAREEQLECARGMEQLLGEAPMPADQVDREYVSYLERQVQYLNGYSSDPEGF